MPGASILADEAAARIGAGYVKYLGKASGYVSTRAIVQAHAPDHYAVRDLLADERTASVLAGPGLGRDEEIGRASCRESVCQYVMISVVAVSIKKQNDITQTSNV